MPLTRFSEVQSKRNRFGFGRPAHREPDIFPPGKAAVNRQYNYVKRDTRRKLFDEEEFSSWILWGGAVAAHQVEGAYDVGGKVSG